MGMNNAPLITVVTVCYNAVNELEKTMLSVLNQTYDNIEYIVIDGGSKDGTVDIIEKYANRLAYWVSEPDKGIYDAMNKGIRAAKGEWINFMNAGDEFVGWDVLERFIPQIDRDVIIAYGDTMMRYSCKTILRKNHPIEEMAHCMVPGHQAAFIRKSYHQIHLYDISFKSSADFNFFYQAYFSKMKFQYIPIVVVNYEAERGVSSVNYRLVQMENARVLGKDKSLRWKVSLFFILKFHYLKKILKSVLPNKIIYLLK